MQRKLAAAAIALLASFSVSAADDPARRAAMAGAFESAVRLAQEAGDPAGAAYARLLEAKRLLERREYGAARHQFRKAAATPGLERISAFWTCAVYAFEKREAQARDCFRDANIDPAAYVAEVRRASKAAAAAATGSPDAAAPHAAPAAYVEAGDKEKGPVREFVDGLVEKVPTVWLAPETVEKGREAADAIDDMIKKK